MGRLLLTDPLEDSLPALLDLSGTSSLALMNIILRNGAQSVMNLSAPHRTGGRSTARHAGVFGNGT
ncbi:hypothetical protein BGX26_004426 [Mortierella sp. AD094]|nr:hypothetical protein BGX26_004426 [Mortierella sp. AD094]